MSNTVSLFISWTERKKVVESQLSKIISFGRSAYLPCSTWFKTVRYAFRMIASGSELSKLEYHYTTESLPGKQHNSYGIGIHDTKFEFKYLLQIFVFLQMKVKYRGRLTVAQRSV